MPDTLTKASGGLLKLPNGNPDLRQRMRRKEIVRLTLDELLERCMDGRIRDFETRDLVLIAKTLDDELRINKLEHSMREPLKIIVQRESGL